jgi:hypothetical protein
VPSQKGEGGGADKTRLCGADGTTGEREGTERTSCGSAGVDEVRWEWAAFFIGLLQMGTVDEVARPYFRGPMGTRGG